MKENIRVAILDDHQSIVDGYMFRLSKSPDVEVIASAAYGEDLEPMLEQNEIDVLLMDVTVPLSPVNSNSYPILHTIPHLFQLYPNLVILVISMHNQPSLINSVMESGASGYILKDDHEAVQNLAVIIRTVELGGIYLSSSAYQQLQRRKPSDSNLTARQIEAISLCAAYPEATTNELALRLGIAHSTFRNLLSGAYLRLDVRNRTAAIHKARQKGLIGMTQ